MANLDPLIRLNKFQLEDKQRVLSKLYADVQALEIQKSAIMDSVESEKEAMNADTQNIAMMQGFMTYLQRTKTEIGLINNQISTLEIKITRAVDEMREAFGELKKIEITRDRRLEDIAKENTKREDALFSEIALEIYRRSKD
jgi:flagellar export protein FliJ